MRAPATRANAVPISGVTTHQAIVDDLDGRAAARRC